MVKIDKLDKYFNKGRSNENHVLKEVSLEMEEKGLVCILGESGSGKTTLLNTIGGLDTFRSGTITVDDVVLKKYEQKKVERLRNQKFGYIFQNYYLLQDYTVAYNVKLALNVFDLTEEQKVFARRCRDEMRSVYSTAVLRMLLCNEMMCRGMVPDISPYRSVFCPEGDDATWMIDRAG